MENQIFDIQFTAAGEKYKGWVNPSYKLSEEGKPISFHVVLDNVSFGYLSFRDGHWIVTEQRPEEITGAIGAEIEKHYSNL